MRTAFQDYYRCPNQFGEFDVAELPTGDGYFTFHEAICYGRRLGTPQASHVTADLPDVSHDVSCSSASAWAKSAAATLRSCTANVNRLMTNKSAQHNLPTHSSNRCG